MADQRLNEADELRALGQRLIEARFQTAARQRESVSRARMAQLVAELTGEALYETQWRRYEAGQSRAPFSVIRAAARLSGLTEAYLFGVSTETLIDPSRDRKLTEDGPDSDRARAARVAETEATRSAPGKAAGKGSRKPA